MISSNIRDDWDVLYDGSVKPIDLKAPARSSVDNDPEEREDRASWRTLSATALAAEEMVEKVLAEKESDGIRV